MNEIYLTISHIDEYCGYNHIKVGDVFKLIKDHNNIYDDEAIAVYDKNNIKNGYVANSVHSVARGTYSAGRLYDLIEDETECEARFILDDKVIALIRD